MGQIKRTMDLWSEYQFYKFSFNKLPSDMTPDEQADEIMNRLRTVPTSTQTMEDGLMQMISRSVNKEFNDIHAGIFKSVHSTKTSSNS